MLQQKVKLPNLCRLKEISNVILKKRIHTHKEIRRFQVHFDRHKQTANTCSFQKLRYSTSVAPQLLLNQEQEQRNELPKNNTQSIDDMLSRIDESARRFGRIFKRDVVSVFEEIKQLGSASTIQSLYLLRCCGTLMKDEIPSTRSQLLTDIWEKLRELDIPVDASHYNAMLKAHLENGHAFTPTDVLLDMDRNKVKPNRVTYQRLIDKFSDTGDLNGVSAILEFMKKEEISVNEAIFNSLIKCHTKLKDFEGAKNTLTFMKNMEKTPLQPSASSYTILACGYAATGDIDGINTTLAEAKKENAYLTNKDLLSIIYSLAISGHHEHMDKIFSCIEDLHPSYIECLNMVLELCNQNVSEDVCYYIVKEIATKANFIVGIKGFIQRLIQLRKSNEKILQYCIDFEDGTNNILVNACRNALECHNVSCSFELFKEMQRKGIPVRHHYFWPILAFHVREQNEQGIWDTLKNMTELGFPMNFDTYMDYVLPGIDTRNIENILAKLKESGQSDMYVFDALLHHYCNINDLESAVFLINNYSVNYNVNVLMRSLLNLAKNDSPKDNDHLLQVLEFVREGSERNNITFKDFYGEFFLALSAMRSLHKSLLVKAHQMGIGLSRSYGTAICNNFSRNEPEKVQIIRSLQYGVPLPKFFEVDSVHPRDMNLESLEKHLVELKASGESTRTTLRHLLGTYCMAKDLEKVLSTKKELDLQGFRYTPALYAQLINTFMSFNDLAQCEDLRSNMEEEFPDAKLDALKVVNYCCLLIKCNRGGDALTLLRKHCDVIDFEQQDMLIRNVRKLINIAAESGNVELTNQIYDFFSQRLTLKDPKSLEGLVKVHLNNNDIPKAVIEYESCLKSHNSGPSRRLLMNKCIMNNDREGLQKVIDLNTAHFGKVSTSHELAFSFIECGQIQRARKVFEDLGQRTVMEFLMDFSAELSRNNKTEEFENLMEATKNFTYIDRDLLYFKLLNLYVKENNCEKALDIWEALQEENAQPSAEILRSLANLLEKNNQPIPFIVPSSEEKTIKKATKPVQHSDPDGLKLTEQLLNSIDSQNVEDVISILEKMKKGSIRYLTIGTMANIITLLIEKNHLSSISNNVQVMSYILENTRVIFKPVLEKASSEGKIDCVKQLMAFLPEFALKSIAFNYYFTQAYLSSGLYDELMTQLENNVTTSARLFSFSGFVKLLTEAPHLENRAEQLVETYVKEENFDIPRRALWVHYFIHEKFDKAEEIFKNNVSLFTGIDMLASQILKHIRATSNDFLGRKFLEFVTEHGIKQVIKDRAHSCFLDVLVSQEKVEEAAEALNKAQKLNIPINKFSKKTLFDLQRGLKEKTLPVAFEIPSQGEDSSSSSDSD